MRLKFRDYNSTVFDAFTTNSNLTKEYISLYSLHKTKGTKGACIYKGDYIIIMCTEIYIHTCSKRLIL